MENITVRKNTVQTVLSERAVYQFECILYWFWNNFDHDSTTNNLLKMLEVYIKHEPDDVPRFQKADLMTLFVCSLIELKDQIKDVQESECPWKWVEMSDGLELPGKEPTLEQDSI